jgi:hypothetical protein
MILALAAVARNTKTATEKKSNNVKETYIQRAALVAALYIFTVHPTFMRAIAAFASSGIIFSKQLPKTPWRLMISNGVLCTNSPEATQQASDIPRR